MGTTNFEIFLQENKTTVIRHIKKYVGSNSDLSKAARIFNELPNFDGVIPLIKQLPTVIKKEQFEAWFYKVIKQAYKDLFDENGDIKLGLKEIFLESGVALTDLASSQFKSALVSSYITNIVGNEAGTKIVSTAPPTDNPVDIDPTNAPLTLFHKVQQKAINVVIHLGSLAPKLHHFYKIEDIAASLKTFFKNPTKEEIMLNLLNSVSEYLKNKTKSDANYQLVTQLHQHLECQWYKKNYNREALISTLAYIQFFADINNQTNGCYRIVQLFNNKLNLHNPSQGRILQELSADELITLFQTVRDIAKKYPEQTNSVVAEFYNAITKTNLVTSLAQGTTSNNSADIYTIDILVKKFHALTTNTSSQSTAATLTTPKPS